MKKPSNLEDATRVRSSSVSVVLSRWENVPNAALSTMKI